VVVHAFTFEPLPVPDVGASSELPLRSRLAKGLNPIAASHATQKEIPVSPGSVSCMDLPLRWASTKENQMFDNEPNRVSQRRKRLIGAASLLLAGGVAGGALAATSSASAADSTASTVAAPAANAPGPPADTATPIRPGEKALTDTDLATAKAAALKRAGEKALTDTDLATAKAAALKAVPGGTVYRVETDADGATYEAHMTKADGTHVTVKFDKSFGVTAIQNGMGAGGPDGHPGGPVGGATSSPSGAGI
jgi:hypothetical protein